MSGHIKTWTLWLEKISPMEKVVTNYSGDDRRLMAEALALAVPSGPRGFACVDECRCGERESLSWSALLYAAIVDKLPERHDADEIMRKLRHAISSDLTRPPSVDFPIDDLSKTGTQISSKTVDIAHARRRFPRTWDAIQGVIQ